MAWAWVIAAMVVLLILAWVFVSVPVVAVLLGCCSLAVGIIYLICLFRYYPYQK